MRSHDLCDVQCHQVSYHATVSASQATMAFDEEDSGYKTMCKGCSCVVS